MQDNRDDRGLVRKNPIKWILLITGLLLIGAWAQDKWDGSHSRSYANAGQTYSADRYGRGQYQDTRDLTGFDSVNIEGAIRLVLTVGPAASVSLDGDQGTIKDIETHVEDGALVIEEPRHGWFGRHGGRVTAHVTVPSLDRLTVSGGNSISISGADKGDSHITINGSARLVARGHFDSLHLTINGAGHAELKGLSVDDATVVINGTGNVALNVSRNLVATVNGVGSVRYIGSPEHVTSSVNGFGSVKRG